MLSEGQYYFDEDELIQDQMMEEEVEDEEMVYEEPEENDDGEEFDHDISNQGRDSTILTNVVEEELRQQAVANSTMEDEKDTELPVSTVTFLQQNKSADLYSFERYNGIWRDNSNSSNNHTVSPASIDGKNAREEFLRISKDFSDTGEKSDGVEGSTRINNIVPSCTDDASLLACFKLRGERRHTTSVRVIRKRHLPARFVYEDYQLLLRQRKSTTPDSLDDYPSTSVSLFNGKRIYLRCLSSQKHQNDHQYPSPNTQLLSHPFSKVIQGANRLQHLWVTAQQQRIRTNPGANNATLPPTHTSNAANPVCDTSKTISAACTSDVKTSTKRDYGDQLWVDKYAPKSFVDLLSEEKTNRNFLRALKEWDPYVFGRSNTTAPINTTAATLKDDKRPPITSRVFLLCGNAGVGKTTLAHIAAKHAGYRPIEINASDDRSPQILKEKVLRAMESTLLATYTKTASNGARRPKPNCIILDEVDGIDSVNAIHALLDIIKQDINSNSNKPYLRRPIIFIANHKYAAALKPLLNYAMVFDVQPPLSSRIVSRCKTVLSSENISIQDNQLLTELVYGSGGDIRSCLHTLQYVALSRQRKKQRHQQLDASCELSAALSGAGTLKDTRGDIAAVLYSVFWNRRRSDGSEIISRGNKKKVLKKKDSGHILNVVESFDDDLKILDCLFTNILTVSYTDPTMDRCDAAHGWLSSWPETSPGVTSTAPIIAAAIHFLCRVNTRPDLQLSNRKVFQAKFTKDANNDLIDCFTEGLTPKFRSFVTSSTAKLELVPYTMWLISAGATNGASLARCVTSFDMLNADEKKMFSAHVSTMRALGLTYRPRDHASAALRNDSGEQVTHTNLGFVSMKLHPEIDLLIRFRGLDFSHNRVEIPDVMKELLAQSVHYDKFKGDNEILKNSGEKGDALTKNKIERNNDRRGGREPAFEDAAAISLKTSSPILHLTVKNFLGVNASRAKAARKARAAALVGFEKSVKTQKVSHTGSGIPLSQVLRFKYQRGFSQAVRVPCKIEDLL